MVDYASLTHDEVLKHAFRNYDAHDPDLMLDLASRLEALAHQLQAVDEALYGGSGETEKEQRKRQEALDGVDA